LALVVVRFPLGKLVVAELLLAITLPSRATTPENSSTTIASRPVLEAKLHVMVLPELALTLAAKKSALSRPVERALAILV
jgi:hypothetical protein